MSSKPFTKHAQRVLNKNPNVVKCTVAKIVFKEEFALKVCDALKNGEDPYKVFTDNGLSLRVLGKSRVNGVIGLWKSKYNLENLPRRKPPVKPKPHVETAKAKTGNLAERAEGKNIDLVVSKACRSTVHFISRWYGKMYDEHLRGMDVFK